MPDLKRFRRRQPFRVRGREIHDQAHHGLGGKVAAANSEPANFDQASQFRRRADPQLSAGCVEMDTVIADQNGGGYLPGAPGQDQIESEPRLAGARRARGSARRGRRP